MNFKLLINTVCFLIVPLRAMDRQLLYSHQLKPAAAAISLPRLEDLVQNDSQRTMIVIETTDKKLLTIDCEVAKVLFKEVPLTPEEPLLLPLTVEQWSFAKPFITLFASKLIQQLLSDIKELSMTDVARLLNITAVINAPALYQTLLESMVKHFTSNIVAFKQDPDFVKRMNLSCRAKEDLARSLLQMKLCSSHHSHLVSGDLPEITIPTFFSHQACTVIKQPAGQRKLAENTNVIIHKLCFAPSGALAVIVEECNASQNDLQQNVTRIRFFDSATGDFEFEAGECRGKLNCCAISKTASLIAVASDTTLSVFSAMRRKSLFENEKNDRKIEQLAFSPDERMLVAAQANVFSIYDALSGVGIRQFSIDERDTFLPSGKLLFSKNGLYLMASMNTGIVYVWDMRTAERVIIQPYYEIDSMKVTVQSIIEDGKDFTLVMSDASLLFYSMKSAECKQRKQLITGFKSLSFSADGSLALGVVNSSPRYVIANVITGEVIYKFQPLHNARGVFSEDNALCAVYCGDDTIEICDLNTKSVVALKGGYPITNVCFSQVLLNGIRCASVTDTSMVALWHTFDCRLYENLANGSDLESALFLYAVYDDQNTRFNTGPHLKLSNHLKLIF